MFVAKSISNEHKDLIHDVSFDFYGRRMATCSSDHSIQVWDIGEDGEWHLTEGWKSHSGSVWRVTWAHPEYGQVIASCSYDRMATVWEEIPGDSSQTNQKSKKHWIKRATLVDSRTSVSDVKFSPKHLGLFLATCSADGIVRCYEAPDVTDLTRWEIKETIQTKMSCSCLSWNPARLDPSTIAVGSDNSNTSAGGKVQIYELRDVERKWVKIRTLMNITEAVHDLAYAPNLGRSYDVLAIATKGVFIMKFDRKDPSMAGPATVKNTSVHLDHDNKQVWQVSWNLTGTVLASSSDEGCVRLWKANYLDKWKCMQVLRGDGSMSVPPAPSNKDQLPAFGRYPQLSDGTTDLNIASGSPKFSLSSWFSDLSRSPSNRQGRMPSADFGTSPTSGSFQHYSHY